MNIAIIPARGGSKGIPKKNLRKINNESLLSRTIKAAKAAKRIDHIYVSSDNQEILNEAIKFEANTIERTKELSLDATSTEPVILDALNKIEERSKKVTLIIILQCTSAFTTPNEIDNVISFLEKNKTKHDAAFAASLFHGFIWKYDINKKIANGINHSSSKARERRQVIKEKQYLELGSVYAVKRESFISSQSRFGFNPKPIPVDSINSYLEIDTFKDLEIASSISLDHS